LTRENGSESLPDGWASRGLC